MQPQPQIATAKTKQIYRRCCCRLLFVFHLLRNIFSVRTTHTTCSKSFSYDFNFNANTEHRIKHFAQINKESCKLATTKCEDGRDVSKDNQQTHSKTSNTPSTTTSEEFQHSKMLYAMLSFMLYAMLSMNFVFQSEKVSSAHIGVVHITGNLGSRSQSGTTKEERKISVEGVCGKNDQAYCVRYPVGSRHLSVINRDRTLY